MQKILEPLEPASNYVFFSNFVSLFKSYSLFSKSSKTNVKFRTSHWRCFVRKGVLRNFAKFTGKHLCQASVYNFTKKETLAQVFSCKFCEIYKNTFCTEHLWATASESWIYAKRKCEPNDLPSWIYFPCLIGFYSENFGGSLQATSHSKLYQQSVSGHPLWYNDMLKC